MKMILKYAAWVLAWTSVPGALGQISFVKTAKYTVSELNGYYCSMNLKVRGDTLCVLCLDTTGWAGKYFYSTDAGASWSNPLLSVHNFLRESLHVGFDGNPVIFWTPGADEARLTWSPDGGVTWTNKSYISTGIHSRMGASGVFANGDIGASYVVTTTSPYQSYYIRFPKTGDGYGDPLDSPVLQGTDWQWGDGFGLVDPATDRFRAFRHASAGHNPEYILAITNDSPVQAAAKVAVTPGGGGHNPYVAVEESSGRYYIAHLTTATGWPVWLREFAYDEADNSVTVLSDTNLAASADGYYRHAYPAVKVAGSLVFMAYARFVYAPWTKEGDVFLHVRDELGAWHKQQVAGAGMADAGATIYDATTIAVNGRNAGLDMEIAEEDGGTYVYLAYGEWPGGNPVVLKLLLKRQKGTRIIFR